MFGFWKRGRRDGGLLAQERALRKKRVKLSRSREQAALKAATLSIEDGGKRSLAELEALWVKAVGAAHGLLEDESPQVLWIRDQLLQASLQSHDSFGQVEELREWLANFDRDLEGKEVENAKAAIEAIVKRCRLRVDKQNLESLFSLACSMSLILLETEQLLNICVHYLLQFSNVISYQEEAERIVKRHKLCKNEGPMDAIFQWDFTKELFSPRWILAIQTKQLRISLVGCVLAKGQRFHSCFIALFLCKCGNEALNEEQARQLWNTRWFCENDLKKTLELVAMQEEMSAEEGVSSSQLESYDWIGFDLDHTLVEYNFEVALSTCFKSYVEHLKSCSAPEDHLVRGFRSLCLEEGCLALAKKGLVLDLETVYLLQLDADNRVVFGFDGLSPLSPQQLVEAGYLSPCLMERPRVCLEENQTRFKLLATQFEQPLGAILASVFGNLTESAKASKETRVQWFNLVKKAVIFYQSKFNPNSMEAMLAAGKNSQNLVPTQGVVKHWLIKLAKQKQSKSFIVTNADLEHAEATMKVAYGTEWKNYFDVILTNAKKTSFFKPDHAAACELLKPGDKTNNGVILRKGSAQSLVNSFLGGSHQKIAFVGDHPMQDVVEPRTHQKWDTVAVMDKTDCHVLGRHSCLSLIGEHARVHALGIAHSLEALCRSSLQ